MRACCSLRCFLKLRPCAMTAEEACLRRSMVSQLSSLPELHLDLVLCKSYHAFQIMQEVIPSAEVRGG